MVGCFITLIYFSLFDYAQDFLALKMETRSKGQANLIVVCDDGSSSLNGLVKSPESTPF